jgi:single-strand DNA-binding protein
MSVNKVILVGNVGKDPETRYLDENTAVCTFPLATSETYKNRSGERVTTTEWHNVVLWRGQAQVAEKYVKKGSQIFIEGRIKTRSYEDANGVKKYVTEIVGDRMQLLGRRPDDAEGGSSFGGQPARPAQQPQATQAAQPAQQAQPAQPSQPAQPAQSTQQPSSDPGTQKPESPGQQGGTSFPDDPFSADNGGGDDLPF